MSFRTTAIVLAVMYAAFGIAAPALAQNVTTGSISGVAVDQQDAVLPGVTIEAVHGPTGTQYSAITDSNGRFFISSVRVGGPYTVTAALSGFRSQEQANINVPLGETIALNFKLALANVAENITVEAEVNPVINPSRTGPAANVSTEQLQNLPTVSRSLEDFARTSPYFSPIAINAEPGALSVAGRNNRYNSIQIDGAVNNDLFGLSATGAPAGQTESQPISIDAIEELQLLVAPYDVRQGGFSGGGLNAVTKSGTNALHGTAYYLGRSESFVGDYTDPFTGSQSLPYGAFSEKIGGGSIGGPIRQNKIFFFGNFEMNRRGVPSGFSVGGSEGVDFGRQDEANRILNTLKTKYNYDPGGLDQFTRAIDNNKFFVRGDVNLSANHRFTVRHNYIDATNDIGRLSLTEFFFPDYFYHFRNKTNSTVGQLNSTFGRMFNELRVNYQRVRDDRDGDTEFPALQIELGLGAGGGLFRVGRERSSSANELDQDIIEITDDFTTQLGSHTVTLGTHNEIFDFRNLFIQNAFGYYTFTSVENFEAGFAQAYAYSYSNTADPLQAANFGVRQYSLYAGDQWRVRPSLTLTYGLRLDAPTFPDTPAQNPLTEQVFGIRTDVTPEGLQWSPRVGFNFNPGGSVPQQVRGGVGIFSGRTPYVWLSNQFTGTGLEFTRPSVTFNAANRIPFVADPHNQPKTVGTAAPNEVNLLDPDYKYPQVLRWNLAYDRTVAGWTTTAEFLDTKTLQDVFYQNLNYAESGQTRPDGRPVLTRVNTTFSNAIFLTNTDQGDQWTASVKGERRMRNGLFASASYLYGRSNTVNDGSSSTAFSNWQFLYTRGNSNLPVLGISDRDVRHRVNAMASYRRGLGAGTALTTSFFYNVQSGRPYSTTYSTDANGDIADNDIAFVPASASDVVIQNGTWDELNAYIEADSSMKDHRGEIPERNTGRGPWTNVVDFRLAFDVPLRGRNNFQITLDVSNFLNMLNNDWGVVRYPNFNEVSPFAFRGVDAATGKMIYDLAPMKAASFRKFQTDDPRSRYQAQLGVRYRF
jgi:Carboxypeptidase regulatory-like domain